MTRNELVQTLPRQLSAISFMELCGEQEDFTDEQAEQVSIEAERIALPGLAMLRKKFSDIQQQLQQKEEGGLVGIGLTLERKGTKLPELRLTATITHNEVSLALVERLVDTDSWHDISYELQHLVIEPEQAEVLLDLVVNQASKQLVTLARNVEIDLRALIEQLPRELRIADLLELIGESRNFNTEEVIKIKDRAKLRVAMDPRN